MISLSMNEAVRRGAWTCFGCSGASRCPQALIAAKHPSSRHQRKHSSSKASNPSKDEARSLTTSGNRSNEAPSVPPVVKRPGGRRFSRTVSKPSAPKARLDVYPNIPSVPSTQHLHPMNVHVASFFSRHRPISVTTSFPPAFSEAAFSSIFEFKPNQATEVLHAVSTAIDSLESAAFQGHIADSEATYAQPKPSRRSSAKAIKRLDSKEDTKVEHISLDIGETPKSFRHFVPPPPPVPQADSSSKPASSSSKRRDLSASIKERTYSTTLTITERTLPNGEKEYIASASPVRTTSSRRSATTTLSSSLSSQPLNPNQVTVLDITAPSSSALPSSSPPRQPFLDRMRKRQQVWEDGLMGKKREMWRAISVKRQRKLKMKKHKYKKLMRKTRNLRRRLDRN